MGVGLMDAPPIHYARTKRVSPGLPETREHRTRLRGWVSAKLVGCSRGVEVGNGQLLTCSRVGGTE